MPTTLTAIVHGTAVEVGCYGSGTDWACRLIYAREHRGPVSDAYYPPPVVGMFWIREQDSLWLASGMVNRDVFGDANTIHELLNRIMVEVIGVDHQLAVCVELIEPRFVAISNGEEGDLFFDGDGLGARWGASPGNGNSR